MNLLGLDSAGKTAGVCLLRDGTVVYESYLAVANTHSETLLQLCDDALRAARLTCADVDAFAVCAGPGSFTGLRIGIAAVKGLAFVRDTPCVPVSTLEALACGAAVDGLVAAALDARRGEVYCALFERAQGSVRRLLPDSAMSAAAFAALLAARSAPVWCLGDGAQLVCAAAPEAVRLYPAAYRLGRACGVCLAAAAAMDRGESVSPAALVPDYHRLSQAERERAEKLRAQHAADAAAEAPQPAR